MMNAKAFMNSASFCGCQASAASFDARIIRALLDTASILVCPFAYWMYDC